MNLPKYISVSNFNKSEDFAKRHKMINDIPKVDYRYLNYSLGWQYNPVTISQYALCLYDEYQKDKDIMKEEMFFKQVEWLEKLVVIISENLYGLPYNFPNKWYSLNAPWHSGMAQGQAASVFIRAYFLSKENKYLDIAKKLLNLMILPVHKGGTLTVTQEGLPWIEEYPSDPPSMVLNGHLYGLIGLAEYYLNFNDEAFKQIYNDLLKSTIELIPLYEKDNWLIYARRVNTNKCNNKYMGLQVLEIKQLFDLTQISEFDTVYKRLNNYANWKAFWKDVNKQNRGYFYVVKNIKGQIKALFPKIYRKLRLTYE